MHLWITCNRFLKLFLEMLFSCLSWSLGIVQFLTHAPPNGSSSGEVWRPRP